MKEFQINIAGLGDKVHEFRFQIGKTFFEFYGKELTDNADLLVDLVLDKHATFLSAEFDIRGTVQLTCDRSLDKYDHALKLKSRILFKYADQAEEVSDEIIHITRDTVALDLGPVLYDLIGSSIPMKKLHPRFKTNEEENEEDPIVYRSGTDVAETEQIDPRWEKLKKLKE